MKFTILFKKNEDVFQNGKWEKAEITTSGLSEFGTPTLYETKEQAEKEIQNRKDREVRIYGEASETMNGAFVKEVEVVEGICKLPVYKPVQGRTELEEFTV